MSSTIDNIKHGRGTVYIHEFLKLVSKTTSREERIALLKTYHDSKHEYARVLRFFAECIFHPAVKFNLPEGTPPYKQIDAPDESTAYTTLFSAFSKVKYFCFGPSMIQNNLKRETQFVALLEQLCLHEVKLMIMIKDKKIDKRVYPMIDESIFAEAFPTWFPAQDAPEAKN